MKKTLLIITVMFLMTACAVQCSSDIPKLTSLSDIKISQGDNRFYIEEQYSALVNQPSTYLLYSNNLYGGQVKYSHDQWRLEVNYAAGVPAKTKIIDGVIKHIAPIDEAVLSYKIYQR